MTTMIDLYKEVYNCINENEIIKKKVGDRIFNHLPENASYPLIKISEIFSNQISCTEFQGTKNVIKLEVISKALSNLECLEIMGNIADLFSKSSILGKEDIFSEHKLLSSSIFQDRVTNFWSGEMEIEIWIFTKH